MQGVMLQSKQHYAGHCDVVIYLLNIRPVAEP